MIQIYQEYYNLCGKDPEIEFKRSSKSIVYKKLYNICKNAKCSCEDWKLINLYCQHIKNDEEG